MWIGDCLWTGKPSCYTTNQLATTHTSTVLGKLTTWLRLMWGAFTCVEWQVTLCDCDPIWQLTLCSP